MGCIVCTPPSLSAGGGDGGELNLLPKFQKGELEKTSTLRRGLLEKSGVIFFTGGLQFYNNKNTHTHTHTHKSEILNDKKFIFCAFTKKSDVKERGGRGGGGGEFADLRGGLARKRGVVFLRGGLIPRCTLSTQ